jgi:hypothetical protein
LSSYEGKNLRSVSLLLKKIKGCMTSFQYLICLDQRNLLLHYLHFVTGVHWMITICCNFWHFSAKKLALFSKTHVQFLHKLTVFLAKNGNLLGTFFVENIFKIITSVTGAKCVWTSGAGFL